MPGRVGCVFLCDRLDFPGGGQVKRSIGQAEIHSSKNKKKKHYENVFLNWAAVKYWLFAMSAGRQIELDYLKLPSFQIWSLPLNSSNFPCALNLFAHHKRL